MGYMMLIVEPRGQREARTQEEGQAAWDRMVRFADGLKTRGLLRMAESLRRDEEGARIQVRGGKSTLVDGPFAELSDLGNGRIIRINQGVGRNRRISGPEGGRSQQNQSQRKNDGV